MQVKKSNCISIISLPSHFTYGWHTPIPIVRKLETLQSGTTDAALESSYPRSPRNCPGFLFFSPPLLFFRYFSRAWKNRSHEAPSLWIRSEFRVAELLEHLLDLAEYCWILDRARNLEKESQLELPRGVSSSLFLFANLNAKTFARHSTENRFCLVPARFYLDLLRSRQCCDRFADYLSRARFG